MTKSNSLFQKLYDIFENWDEEAFRNHHHEDLCTYKKQMF